MALSLKEIRQGEISNGNHSFPIRVEFTPDIPEVLSQEAAAFEHPCAGCALGSLEAVSCDQLELSESSEPGTYQTTVYLAKEVIGKRMTVTGTCGIVVEPSRGIRNKTIFDDLFFK